VCVEKSDLVIKSLFYCPYSYAPKAGKPGTDATASATIHNSI